MGEGPVRWKEALRSLGRAALFLLLVFALTLTGVLAIPGLAEAPLPDGGGFSAGLVAQFGLALIAALAATWVLRAAVERRAADGLGFPLDARAPRDGAVGLAIGAAGIAVVIALLAVAGVYRFVGEGGSAGAWLATAGVSLVAFVIPAAAEEAVFRGYLLGTLTEGTGATAAVVITSLLFALLHGGNPAVGPLAFANLFLAGVLLALAVLRTGTLWLATGVHVGWNWSMAGPLDLPVSGLDAYDIPLYDAVPAPPAWLSGGAFGPEGGIAGTVAALTVLALILAVTRPGARLAPASDGRI